MRSVLATARRAGSLLRIAWASRRLRRATTDADRRAARGALAGLLGGAGGMVMKIGQVGAALGGEELRPLLEGVPARPFARIRPSLERALAAPLERVFAEFAPEAIAASVGQVHRARLHDGREVAVKVRYPGIDRAIAAEMTIAGWMPNAGPARVWGFDLEAYRRLLRENMTRELDYLGEAERQRRFAESVVVPGLVVPRVVDTLCRTSVLVQSWETGAGLHTAAAWPLGYRLRLAQTALRTLFVSTFKVGELHADPHPGNLLCRLGTTGPELVVLDFGSTLTLTSERRRSLLALLLALRSGDDARARAALVAVGFDAAKLRHLHREAGDLCRLMFAPLLADRPFDLATWDVSARSAALLGDLRWWFRSAAPADALLFVRAFFGIAKLVQGLDVRLPWWPVLTECVGEALLAEASAWQPQGGLEEAPPAAGATRLQVSLLEHGSEVFSLSLPAAEARRLQQHVPEAVATRLDGMGIHLAAIEERLRHDGLDAQNLLHADLGDRQIRVWLA